MDVNNSINVKMARHCEIEEQCQSGDLKKFWHNAKVGYMKRWANELKANAYGSQSNTVTREELKQAFSGGCDLLKDKQRHALKKLGFSIEERRKHFMLTYKGLKREYHFTVSKTPSDKRSSLNLISIIANTLKEDEQG